MTRRHKSGRSVRHPSVIIEYKDELWRMTHRQYLAFLYAGRASGSCPLPDVHGGRKQNSIIVRPGDWSKKQFVDEAYEHDGTASENAQYKRVSKKRSQE